MITLYPDQQDLIDRTRQAMRRHKSVLMRAGTGSGKTVMASWLVASAQARGKRTWFTVPRKELTVQTSETYKEFNIPHSHIAAEYPFNPYSKSHVCSVGTLIRRLDSVKPPDLAIIDEAHFGGESLDVIIKWLKKHGSWVIGLSATPWRLSGEGLGRWYDDMVEGPSTRWLIDNKRLSDYRLFAPNRPDLSGIKTVAGDYAKGQLSEFMEHDQILIGDAVKYYMEHGMGKLGVTYCASRKHSRMTAERYREAGVMAMHIDGETPAAERRQIIRDYAKREILQLCNAQLLTFGFDLAAQVGRKDICVEAMTDLGPTKSLSQQSQKWGRVLRYKPYPAMIFDHASNIHYHGLPCADRDWTLDDRNSSMESEFADEKTIPVRTCDKCFFSHKAAPKCPECGHVYPVKYREIDEVDGELGEINIAEMKARQEKDMKKKLHQLIAVGRKRGYKDPEAFAAKIVTEQMRGGRA